MNTANSDYAQHQSLAQNVKAVLWLQGVASVLALGAGAVVATLADVELLALLKATAYGCLLAVAGTWLSARSVRRATELKQGASEASPMQQPVSLVPIFSGLLNKLVIVGGGIAFGLIVLALHPIAVIAAYLFVQLAGATQLLMFNKAA